MKTLNNYICERLKISSDLNRNYNYFPKTKNELKDIIKKLLDERGPDANLNDIDVSQITDMISLFAKMVIHQNIGNIDISEWDVSNVKYMSWMFTDQDNFNCDLSHWNVSQCENMSGMFEGCSNFNSNISDWDVSNVKNINRMFLFCTKLDVNLDNWKINPNCKMYNTFFGCQNQKTPKWYTNKKIE